jgi:hypothetical protein
MTLKRSTIAVVSGRSGMAIDNSAGADEDQIRALIDDRIKAVRAKTSTVPCPVARRTSCRLTL